MVLKTPNIHFCSAFFRKSHYLLLYTNCALASRHYSLTIYVMEHLMVLHSTCVNAPESSHDAHTRSHSPHFWTNARIHTIYDKFAFVFVINSCSLERSLPTLIIKLHYLEDDHHHFVISIATILQTVKD